MTNKYDKAQNLIEHGGNIIEHMGGIPYHRYGRDISKDTAETSVFIKEYLTNTLIEAKDQLALHQTEHAGANVIALDNLAIAKAQLAIDVMEHKPNHALVADRHAVEQYTAAVKNTASSEGGEGALVGDSDHVTHDQVFRR